MASNSDQGGPARQVGPKCSSPAGQIGVRSISKSSSSSSGPTGYPASGRLDNQAHSKQTSRRSNQVRRRQIFYLMRESVVINQRDARALDPLRQRREMANRGDHSF